jgi:hypothetical protein
MKQLFTTIKKQSEKHEIINPKYALDFLLLVKIPLKLDVNSVSLVQHTSSVCLLTKLPISEVFCPSLRIPMHNPG